MKALCLLSSSTNLSLYQIIIFIALKSILPLLPFLFIPSRMTWISSGCSSFLLTVSRFHLKKMQICWKRSFSPSPLLRTTDEESTSLPPLRLPWGNEKALNKIFIRKSSCFLLVLYVHVLCFFMELDTFSRVLWPCMKKRADWDDARCQRVLVLLSAKNGKAMCTSTLHCSNVSRSIRTTSPTTPSSLACAALANR